MSLTGIVSPELTGITQSNRSAVYIDPRLLERLNGKRVLLVEDVISTGGTVSTERQLMDKIGANVVGIVTAVKETNVWVEKLGAIAPHWPAQVYAPIQCPLFQKRTRDGFPSKAPIPLYKPSTVKQALTSYAAASAMI